MDFHVINVKIHQGVDLYYVDEHKAKCQQTKSHRNYFSAQDYAKPYILQHLSDLTC